MRSGAYGLCLPGLDGARDLLTRAPSEWPTLAISHEARREVIGHDRVDEQEAHFTLQGGAGTVRLTRSPLAVRFRSVERPADGSVVHPFLALTAAISNYWLGRSAFHAGALLVDGAAWVLLGDKGFGKSSLLAQLAEHGVDVVTDDVSVIEGSTLFAGPRCIDLRADTAEFLGRGEPLGKVGARERWRLRLPPIQPTVPLRGWLVPAWHDSIVMEPVPAAERLTLLLSNLALTRPPRDPAALLRLAALPFWRIGRPRRWDHAEETARALVEGLRVGAR